MSDVPKRDVETQTVTPVPAPTPEQKTEAKAERKTWRQSFNVKEDTVIDKFDSFEVACGINEYEGTYQVFIAKATSPTYTRQFFAMPAWVWQKTLAEIGKYAERIGAVEKKAMADAVIAELKRLKELGVDIAALAAQL